MKKRTWSDDDLTEAVKESDSLGEVIRRLGLTVYGSSYQTIKKHILRLNLETSHWTRRRNLTCRLPKRQPIPLEELLVEDSNYSRSNLKRRLLHGGLIRNTCAVCGLSEVWNNEPIVMVIDHINGIATDNRLENLRMLCPNCNSQQSTFAGRNSKINRFPKVKCKECGKDLCKENKSGYCSTCYPRVGRVKKTSRIVCTLCGKALRRGQKYCSIECKHIAERKVVRPQKDELAQIMKEDNWCAIGRRYGVSDNAVRKWAKSYGLI